MSEPGLVNITGRLRSPAAIPGHWAGCVPPNKGLRYPADPPTRMQKHRLRSRFSTFA